MSATMTFLTIPDGSLAYQDSATTGTLSAVSPTYAASYWAGHQGVVIASTTNIKLANSANAFDRVRGSIMMRCKVPSSSSGWRTLVSLGGGGHIWMRINSTSNTLGLSITTGGPAAVSTANAAANGTEITAYCEWDNGVLGVALNDGDKATVPLVSGVQAFTSDALALGENSNDSDAATGFVISGAVGFDQPLSGAERQFLMGSSNPWTWGMDLFAPIPGYIDVLPSNGANANAPVIVLS